MKELLEKRFGIKLKELQPNTKHEVDKIYFSGYWLQTYKVLNCKDEPYKNIACLWQDGQINTHSTALDYKRDYEVIL